MFFWANASEVNRLTTNLFPQGGHNGISPPHSLLDLLSSTNIVWDEVAARAEEAPQELRHRDAVRKDTPLFLAIQKDAPPYVIRTFLQAYPQAASHVQRLGLTPLHLCVARGSDPEVVSCILNAWPEAAQKKMNDGCVPLHFVRNVETARLLLEAYPSALLVTNNASFLPLHRVAYASYASAELLNVLVFAKDSEKHRTSQQQQLATKTFHGVTPLAAVVELIEADIRQSAPVCPLRWKKLEILARATYYHTHNEQKQPLQGPRINNIKNNSFCFLHVLLEMENPSFPVIRHALQIFPYQRDRLDNLDRSALTIAASRREVSCQILSLLLHDPVLRRLAGKADCTGRWPLHHAVVADGGGRKYSNGLEELWRADPRILTTPCRQTNLYPVLLAAMNTQPSHCDANNTNTNTNTDSNQQQLNTIYCLLRETPWLIPKTTRTRKSTFASKSIRRTELWVQLYGIQFFTRDTLFQLLLWFGVPLGLSLLARAVVTSLLLCRGY